jgi:hypothetical protein
MDNEKKVLMVARGLLGATRDGRVDWKETDTDDCYVMAASVASITISKANDSYYILSFNSPSGSEMDSLSTGDEGVSGQQILVELYELARRRALNVDKAFDLLLREFGGWKYDDEETF